MFAYRLLVFNLGVLLILLIERLDDIFLSLPLLLVVLVSTHLPVLFTHLVPFHIVEPGKIPVSSRLPYTTSEGYATLDTVSSTYRQQKNPVACLMNQHTIDELTGLPNRTMFQHTLDQAIDTSRTDSGPLFAIILLDCDHFKTVNDSLGHPVGDQLLIAVAERLTRCIRSRDTIARLGGDEFAILMNNIDDEGAESAVRLAQRILYELTLPFALNNQDIYISASIGIAISNTGYHQGADILRDADTALHHAKSLGRGCYAIFESGMHARAIARLELDTDLRRAVERHELCVFYQPIVSLDTGTITGFEALVRWQHPQRGLLSPSDFLPLADEIGLITTIDRWVMYEAAYQLQQWITEIPGTVPLSISVNVNGKQLADASLASYVQSILNETGLDPSCLRLEITEDTVIDQPDIVIQTLKQLRGLGVQVSLDDFGTGYSSLSYLHRLPINTLKIDRSFISGVDADTQMSEIVRAIVTLAHNLGLDVIAEGAETVEHLDRLRGLGCEYGQGFYFSRPVDMDQAANLLKSQRRYLAPRITPVAAAPRQPAKVHPQDLLPGAPAYLSMVSQVVLQEMHAPTPSYLVPLHAQSGRTGGSYVAPVPLVDPLTGLPTRESLHSAIVEAIEQSKTLQQSLALAVIDLDHFKSINDAFGHTRGDEVLIEFAQRARAMLRHSDTLFRYGGDEFVLLLPKTNNEQSHMVTQRLLAIVRDTPFSGDPSLSLSISMGVASFPPDGQTPETLFDVADRRNYQAKRAGRGCAVHEDPHQIKPSLIEVPSRLIERDGALQQLHQFLEALILHERGVLQIVASPGCGISRILTLAQDNATMLNYDVLLLSGKASMKDRVYGALHEAIRHWHNEDVCPAKGMGHIADIMRVRTVNGQMHGVVLILDNVSAIDYSTLTLIHNLFVSTTPLRLALIYATRSPEITYTLPCDASLYDQIFLEPLSLTGIRTWLRYCLNWEAPTEFLSWLHHQTLGLPATIKQGLAYLVEHDVIKAEGTTWTYRSDLATIPLAEFLERQQNRPEHNLPIGLREFVGRESDIERVKELLREHRLVTLIGPGGMGKTRLALQSAVEWGDTFPDGVWLVPLSSVKTIDFVLYAIIEVLALVPDGFQSPHAQLLNYLRTRTLVLILDTFEHLRDDASFLTDIIDQAPGVHVLITSRDRLALPGAATFELGGLPYPAETEQTIEHYSAVQVFMRSARQAYPDFSLTQNDVPHLARICRLVEGMPLALELAAAWVRTFSCEAIAKKIELNLSFLATDQPALAEHHRSLLAMIDSFWFLLSASEQSLLRQLSVFRGGFTGGAARQIVGASPFFLEGLVAKGYLRWTQHQRYEIHELLRQYAADKASAFPMESHRAYEQHSAYYLSLVQQYDMLIAGSRHIQHEISADLENIRHAWEWALDQRRVADIEASIQALMAFFDLKGMFFEAEATFGNAAETVRHRLHLSGHSAHTEGRVVSALLAARAHFLNRLACYDEAIQTTSIILVLAQQAEDDGLEAIGRHYFADALWQQGFYSDARVQFERAVELAHHAGVHALEADSLRKLGRVACEQGNYADARVCLDRSLAISRVTGNRQLELRALNDAGILADSQGDFLTARDQYEQCLALAREAGDRPAEAYALLNLGAVASDQGDYARAEEYFEHALPLFRESGDRRHEGMTLENLGDCARMQGDLVRARSYYEQTLQQCRLIGDRQGESYMLSNLGLLAHREGQNNTARSLCELALQIAHDIGDTHAEAKACTFLGFALADLNWLEHAEHQYRHVLDLAHTSGNSYRGLDALAGLARIALQRGSVAQAMEWVESILAYLTTESLDGTVEPFHIYLTCYRVLCASQDTRAQHIVQRAYDSLVAQARSILNVQQRHAFLHEVAVHREILNAVSTATID